MALFPFKPLEDHFFGHLIGNVWKVTNGDFEKLNRAIHSSLLGELQHYTCTPKGDKIVLMNIYPNQFRKYLELKQYDKLYSEFTKLITAKIPETIPRLDIALDLLEWIFIGFPDEDKVYKHLLLLSQTNKFPSPKNFG